ncbi:prepilin peptidase [Candidatus Uhrbacteria bacterium]|nr:prepilin peptidase [Candidatus Uhrbacteria bacterium]
MLGVFLFLLGASVGSFFAAWAGRGSLAAVARGRSSCRNCTLTLHGHHLVPIVSWLFLRGRCAHCKISIPLSLLVTEAAFGVLFLLLWFVQFGSFTHVPTDERAWLGFAVKLLFLLMFGILALFDWYHMTLPDRLTVPFITMAAVVNILLEPTAARAIDLLSGAAILAAFFGLQYLLSRGRWIGAGDIRFGVLLGAMFGVSGVFVAAFGYVIGAAVSIVLLATGLAHRKTALPLGLFLSLGGAVFLLLGDWLVRVLYV